MAGIYQRDNLNLAAAIDSAIRNRMAFEQREADRRNDMVKAGSNALMALGRTAEMSQQDDEALLAKLQKEREEAIAAQMGRDAELRAGTTKFGGPSVGESYTQAMAGYRPAQAIIVPDYASAMQRRGVYPKQDFDGVI